MARVEGPSSRAPRALPALVGVVTTAVLGAAMARSSGPWTLALDAGVSFLGQTVTAFRTWAAGGPPEWTDLLWGGLPLLAEPTTAALYPPHVLAYVATIDAPLRFFDVVLALHMGLLAAGSTRLVQVLGAATPAAVLAGVLAVLAPIGHNNAFANVAGFGALAWVPWALVAAERLVSPATRRLGGAMLLGWAALAGQVLVGMPEFAFYTGIITALWIALRRGGLGIGERLVRIALLALGALATCAPQILATLAVLPATIRSGAAPSAELGSLWLPNPLVLFVPGLMSTVPGFVGCGALALALTALIARRTGAAILAGVAVVTFVLALGPQAGLYAWLREVPPFDRFRAPVKFYGFSEYLLVWCAALGADVLLRRTSPALRALAAVLALLAVGERIAFTAIDEPPLAARIYAKSADPSIVDELAGAPMLRAHLPQEPPPLVLDMGPVLRSGFAGSLGALVGVSSIHAGGVSLLPRTHEKLLYGGVSAPAVALYGIRFALPAPDQCDRQARRLGWSIVGHMPTFCILADPTPAPAFSAVTRAHAVESVDAMIDAVKEHREDAVPVVTSEPVVTGLGPGRVTSEAYRAGDVRLRTTSADRMLLLVRQSLVPGWSASVDGAPADILPAAGLFFAVPLPPGEHVVTLRYRAPGFRTGLAIAAVWWLGVAVLARRRRAVS